MTHGASFGDGFRNYRSLGGLGKPFDINSGALLFAVKLKKIKKLVVLERISLFKF